MSLVFLRATALATRWRVIARVDLLSEISASIVLQSGPFLSRDSIAALWRDIHIAILSVCLSVCPSVTFPVVLKKLNISSHFLQHVVAQSF